MFDTHCHLNFSRFKDTIDQVICDARKAGVSYVVIPGTDVPTSQKAIEIAEKYEGVYAAVGIHPHHVYKLKIKEELQKITQLITHKKVVAIGEVGLDRHVYENTKYADYQVSDEFIKLQKEILITQIELAVQYHKSLILHNREAKNDLLPILADVWDNRLKGRVVFHCCEPDNELLQFAKKNSIFIGVDGDVTYDVTKQEFVKQVPLEMLVLETDSPYLLPEPLRSQKKYPNKPENLVFISDFIAQVKKIGVDKLRKVTTENGKVLFNIR